MSQMGNVGGLPRGESRYPTFTHSWPSACSVVVRQYRLLFYDRGIQDLNVHIKLGACRTYEGGSDTNKSAQELTKKLPLTLPRPCIEPRVFWFEFRHPNHWATFPVTSRDCLKNLTSETWIPTGQLFASVEKSCRPLLISNCRPTQTQQMGTSNQCHCRRNVYMNTCHHCNQYCSVILRITF